MCIFGTHWVSAGSDFRVTSERNTNPGPEEDCSIGLNLQQEDLLSTATVKTILGPYFKLNDVIHLEEEVTVTERILISYVWELLMLNGLWSVSDWSLQNACFYPFRTKIINMSVFDIIFECIERLFLSFDVFLIIWVAPCKTSLFFCAEMKTHNEPKMEMKARFHRTAQAAGHMIFWTGCRWWQLVEKNLSLPAILYTLSRLEPTNCFSLNTPNTGVYERRPWHFWMIMGHWEQLSLLHIYTPSFTLQHFVSYSHQLSLMLS